MVTYADYNYYIEKYKGTLDNSSFNTFAIQATLKIKNFTHNRATSDIQEVKDCMCQLVDVMYKHSKENSELTSEKVDNYTRNFVVKGNAEKNKEYYTVVSEYLGILGLLGGGVPVVY